MFDKNFDFLIIDDKVEDSRDNEIDIRGRIQKLKILNIDKIINNLGVEDLSQQNPKFTVSFTI